ncbi:Peptidase C19 ubiquitin carboxyl-terminal hydrolase 2 [Neofusicoccum parvum]|nr:putative peptidase c19 ubiquitin carboxyl-terminal hydrolase 2 protein [Neofusicoccum parvum UCRNP2]GME46281.1 Peptidase C19 ubiquitin carboxyl-terminal hydrolase 2 [Neofusicoccum parvum]GME50422.1 Peptidase C19 ubiquitin carboxyl-terminal hydrolase 2 [Neofusicoccum parvum]
MTSRNPTGPSTPADESKTSFLSSRRSSKAKKSGSKSRPTSQSGEGRLSITMSRLTGRKSRDKLSDTLPLGGADTTSKDKDNNGSGGDDSNVEGDPANPLVLVEAPTNNPTSGGFQKSATVAFGRGKKEKKIRRTSSVPLADELAKTSLKEGGGKGKAKKKPPDRECVVM